MSADASPTEPTLEELLEQAIARIAAACGVRSCDVNATYRSKTGSCEIDVTVDLGSKVVIIERSGETFDEAGGRAADAVERERASQGSTA